MARYIDADKIVDIIKMDIKQCEIDVSESCGDEFYEMAVNSRSNAMYSILREIENAPTADVVPKSEYDILKSLITHKEEESYKKGYNDALKDVEEMIKNISEREK